MRRRRNVSADWRIFCSRTDNVKISDMTYYELLLKVSFDEMATLRQVLSISVSEPLFCLKADNALEEDLRIDFAFYSM